jgi:hypothetical protein
LHYWDLWKQESLPIAVYFHWANMALLGSAPINSSTTSPL